MIKKFVLSPWTALLTLVLIIAVKNADFTFVESVKLRYFDTLITHEPVQNSGVHTVNIDEATLNKYGQWPFSRDIYAKLIEDTFAHGAGLVVFNVMMPEKDRFGKDDVLATTLHNHPVVLPNAGDMQNKNTPRHPGASIIGVSPVGLVVEYPGIIANTQVLEEAASGVGLVNTFPEVDGVVRRAPLVILSGQDLYPALSLETLRVAAGDPSFQIKLNDMGVDKMRIPAFGPIQTDSLGRVWVDWQQRATSHSAMDMPNFDKAIVIIGTTARGISNPVATSRGEVFPHELQASVLGTMIAGTNIQRPAWADSAELFALIAISIIMLVLSRWVYVGLASGVILLGAVIPVTMYFYHVDKFLLDGTFILAGGVLVMLHAYGIKFVSEFLQKQQIKKQFGSYVNPTIVERLQKDPSLIKLGGEKRELSIVMTDLRGFTTLGESFGDDVEGLTQIMNDYMTALSIPVLKNDGTLIKFIGDASLHVHGAPIDDVYHARNAVKTALEMIKAIEDFNVTLVASGRPPVGMGAGVNTGPTLIGNIGAKSKFGYDVLGDSVSTAARLEGQTKSYGVLLIIGPHTAELVKDDFPVVWLDNIAVKGKTIGLDIYAIGHTVAYMHEEYKKEYLRGDWKKAITWAKTMVNDDDVDIKHYYELMIERMEGGLPPNWSGTYHAMSK